MDSRRSSGRRPRELRRKVMLPARMRSVCGWSDACILNVSSRGLMIHARGEVEAGTTIELHHRERAIVAQVMWRDGTKAGLRCEDHVPVEDILILGKASLAAPAWTECRPERRRLPRAEASRLRARAIEFVAVGAVAVVLALGMATMAETALAKPLAAISAALGG